MPALTTSVQIFSSARKWRRDQVDTSPYWTDKSLTFPPLPPCLAPPPQTLLSPVSCRILGTISCPSAIFYSYVFHINDYYEHLVNDKLPQQASYFILRNYSVLNNVGLLVSHIEIWLTPLLQYVQYMYPSYVLPPHLASLAVLSPHLVTCWLFSINFVPFGR